jgi:sugar lactone lactonase YvrE
MITMQTDAPVNIFHQTESDFCIFDFRFFASLPDGRGLISCHANNAVMIVNSSGDIIGQLSEGIAKPEGIAVNSKGIVHVVDRHNNCIHVFDKDLIHQRGIVMDFQEPGKLNQPVGIAISKLDDRIVIADNENQRVLVLTEDGKYISTLKASFFCPCGVALYNHPVHGELTIVSEWGAGRVQVFKPDGALFSLYGGIEHAHHVVVDAHGIIHVTEYSNQKVKRFDLNGELFKGGEWDGSVVSLVSDDQGLTALVMRNQVVKIVKGAYKKRKAVGIIL